MSVRSDTNEKERTEGQRAQRFTECVDEYENEMNHMAFTVNRSQTLER